MKTFETGNTAAEELSRKTEHVPDFAKDAKLVFETFDKSRPRINERDFANVYPKEEIEQDIKLTERLRTEFARRDEMVGEGEFPKMKEIQQLAATMEVIVAQPLSWWGEGRTTRASLYDDYAGGIDDIYELPGDRHIGFAFDFSTSANNEIIKRKMDRATGHVTNPAKPAEVKYYVSPITKKRERITVIPVIIGLDGNDAKKLVGLMAGIIRLREQSAQSPVFKKKLAEEFEKLQKHPAQMVFILEINSQLERYRRLLEGSTDPRLVATRQRVDEMILFIRALGDSRAKEGVWVDALEEDGVFKTIRNLAER